MRERRKNGIDAILPPGWSELRSPLEVAQNALDEPLVQERSGHVRKDLKPSCDETRTRMSAFDRQNMKGPDWDQKLAGECQEADGVLRYCAVN